MRNEENLIRDENQIPIIVRTPEQKFRGVFNRASEGPQIIQNQANRLYERFYIDGEIPPVTVVRALKAYRQVAGKTGLSRDQEYITEDTIKAMLQVDPTEQLI